VQQLPSKGGRQFDSVRGGPFKSFCVTQRADAEEPDGLLFSTEDEAFATVHGPLGEPGDLHRAQA